jgi:hypothetical protein
MAPNSRFEKKNAREELKTEQKTQRNVLAEQAAASIVWNSEKLHDDFSHISNLALADFQGGLPALGERLRGDDFRKQGFLRDLAQLTHVKFPTHHASDDGSTVKVPVTNPFNDHQPILDETTGDPIMRDEARKHLTSNRLKGADVFTVMPVTMDKEKFLKALNEHYGLKGDNMLKEADIATVALQDAYPDPRVLKALSLDANTQELADERMYVGYKVSLEALNKGVVQQHGPKSAQALLS